MLRGDRGLAGCNECKSDSHFSKRGAPQSKGKQMKLHLKSILKDFRENLFWSVKSRLLRKTWNLAACLCRPFVVKTMVTAYYRPQSLASPHHCKLLWIDLLLNPTELKCPFKKRGIDSEQPLLSGVAEGIIQLHQILAEMEEVIKKKVDAEEAKHCFLPPGEN